MPAMSCNTLRFLCTFLFPALLLSLTRPIPPPPPHPSPLLPLTVWRSLCWRRERRRGRTWRNKNSISECHQNISTKGECRLSQTIKAAGVLKDGFFFRHLLCSSVTMLWTVIVETLAVLVHKQQAFANYPFSCDFWIIQVMRSAKG